MGTYSIRDLEKLTGIKAHTIRIWEQRYRLVTPERSDTNIRNYCDANLKRLISIAILNRHGYKISKIAYMPDDEIAKAVIETLDIDNDSRIDNLVLAMIDMNEQRFERVLNHAILQLGFEDTLVHIVYPFLCKVGLLWLTGTIIPAQEHFICNLVRQKIIAAIDGLQDDPSLNTPSYFLFLPEWEMHEMSLLFYAYLLKKRGFPVIYLGQMLPFDNLKAVYDIKNPEHLLTIFTTGERPETLQTYINNLSREFPEATIHISGVQIQDNQLSIPANVKPIIDPDEFRMALDEVAIASR